MEKSWMNMVNDFPTPFEKKAVYSVRILKNGYQSGSEI
jgi:hypothetical protein